MNLTEQLHHWEHYWYEAVRYEQEWWEYNCWQSGADSREVLIESEPIYHDRSWHLSGDEVEWEGRCEKRDSINYSVMRIRQDEQALVVRHR